jgi:hypothetical protein
MERHDQPGTRSDDLGDARDLRDARDLGDDRRDDSARPEQPGEGGFETGAERTPETPVEELEPNFARGISAEPPAGGRHGRFSEGEEELPRDAGEKDVERRFSEGIERSPDSE